ncbi:MAG: DUF5615 family PIN-like protein [Candidatus Marinimicrobia bacterium]|nr:DUF5615 family PIN-like protein [Candidatus Neomarinimicrobiota bacterium]MCF7840731.1 DUF5615 family PIN-like protein [Candidatus Neomarinimicrobiota bacterium]MCF7901891.1 DUF5615 family PIN-like protein [Candidatus Neomarinimicrobiota bacterium]
MKLLFDQNLSYRLVAALAAHFPESQHVRDIGLAVASDSDIWDYAKSHNFAIVSKDSDFHQRSLTFGPPPKVIWIQRGNCSTDDIIAILRTHVEDIQSFGESTETAFLELS